MGDLSVQHAAVNRPRECVSCDRDVTHVYVATFGDQIIRICPSCVSDFMGYIYKLRVQGVITNRGRRKKT